MHQELHTAILGEDIEGGTAVKLTPLAEWVKATPPVADETMVGILLQGGCKGSAQIAALTTADYINTKYQPVDS